MMLWLMLLRSIRTTLQPLRKPTCIGRSLRSFIRDMRIGSVISGCPAGSKECLILLQEFSNITSPRDLVYGYPADLILLCIISCILNIQYTMICSKYTCLKMCSLIYISAVIIYFPNIFVLMLFDICCALALSAICLY